jgi:hypothetical protein
MSKRLAPWKFVTLLDVSEDGCEFQLFKTAEDAQAIRKGKLPAYVGGDVAYGEGSSWTEYGAGVTDDPYCDDNVVCERENVAPWKSKEAFDAWVAALTQVGQ